MDEKKYVKGIVDNHIPSELANAKIADFHIPHEEMVPKEGHFSKKMAEHHAHELTGCYMSQKDAEHHASQLFGKRKY